MLQYALKNDPSPFHVDEEAAKNSPYGGLIASGGYTVTLWYRSQIPILAKVAFLGGSEWHIKLPLPVRPRDTLRTEITLMGKRPSSKPGRGYVPTTLSGGRPRSRSRPGVSAMDRRARPTLCRSGPPSAAVELKR